MENPIGIYIHVPFCLSKCPYCDFYSVKYEETTVNAYVQSVLRAIRQNGYKNRKVDTIYFGGGTPVLLGAENLAEILSEVFDNFNVESPEITIEANPAAILEQELARLRKTGFDRISFGVQSAVDAELSELGRIHGADAARQSILGAWEAGFENISADLMLGISNQTVESVKASIEFLAGLPLSHISAYMLKIEENTPFAAKKKSGQFPDEDALAEMYLTCVSVLSGYGFEQYEISNFAKNGAVSRHNLKYWRCGEYLGIGAAAHSFMDGRRFYFPRGLDGFVEAENPFDLTVFDDTGGGFEEYAMLRLRLREGLDLKEAVGKYGIDASAVQKKAGVLAQNRLVEINGDVISLTPQGFLLSNAVTAKLLF